jgi:AcrR family transcriptional regulator
MANIETTAPADDRHDSAKRRQIMTGAQAVFLAQGFDGASMGEIARKAGVSKGTLYVYFESKEQLFEAIFEEECYAQAEQVLTLDCADRNVAAALTRFGCDLARFLCQPSGLSPLRTIISIADRMPDIGRRFYQVGPARGIAVVKAYLDAQVAAGLLAIDDTELSASQFIEACAGPVFKPMLFNFSGAPGEERIKHVVDTAVRTFMAAHARS